MNTITISSPEIWSRTCDFLGSKDLAELSRQTTTLLHQARPILYENVLLRGDRKTLSATFDLLKGNVALAETLRLPFDPMCYSFTRLEGDLVTPDMLPNLRTLACHITILEEFLRLLFCS
jgi:hypothetical protein